MAKIDDSEKQVFSVVNQYIKDLSFEAPESPVFFIKEQNKQPKIQINVQVNSNSISDDCFDVLLSFNIEAKIDEKVIFILELSYGGVFRITNFSKENMPLILLVECPRLLFPFVRQIISNTVKDAGFPPLMIDNIDFLKLLKKDKYLKGDTY
ncbi:protein-export chaperone SecB [Candidatus Liberibacter americanus]|uniref:Protein-export protein SecB n=1 Tax=Candidatus Liberibacter americanus str. Sao Paulo TaxID=1261131 RepID=U6B4F6_9HYPH|nr:protein-export chaperone SecB [Candidatus Liberibacter americanus]AHA27513.1 Preprotein translocase subunit SecB [Candidatus Liberibacter americanus str. Sao Paulo]EMS36525.1 preprotein translocase subunit SecB [Candidatus Liberibacter americanus PW_SP]